MSDASYEIPSAENPPVKRLDSWKEIASYLNRDVTTVQRWEKREGMPVHRHVHEKRGSVYALTEELDAWIESRRPQVEGAGTAPAAVPAPAAEIGSGTRKVSRGRLGLALAVLCLAVIVVAWMAWRGRAKSTAVPRIRSLAVLPLRNLSGDSAEDYLADGMTEALIGRLSEIHNLRVISHTSVMRFRNPQVSVPEIAKELGVDAVVEGSVIREGNRIRVTAQLIRGATDAHFWSETYDRELRDALALESEVAQAIAEKVEVTVTGEERQRLTATRVVAPEVYESYLKGRFLLGAGNTQADLGQSVSDFEDAIHRDATFAPAYLGLALANSELGTVYAGGSPEETRPQVIRNARKALALDPNLVKAHVVLANVLQEDWQWTEAEAEYRRALALNPNAADAHSGFALWLLCQGRAEEAVAWIERGRELDPATVSGNNVAWILFQTRHYSDAIREQRSMLALHPGDANAHFGLGFALIANNQAADAVPVLEKAVVLSKGSPAVLGVLVRAYVHAGRRNDALKVLAELKARRAEGYIPAGAFVNAYLGLDDKEQAFYWLEQAYKEKSNILQFVKTHPYFDSIRGDPRFADLIRRVGLN
jgi:TolB-like protein/Flp pilus assembly protein TadD